MDLHAGTQIDSLREFNRRRKDRTSTVSSCDHGRGDGGIYNQTRNTRNAAMPRIVTLAHGTRPAQYGRKSEAPIGCSVTPRLTATLGNNERLVRYPIEDQLSRNHSVTKRLGGDLTYMSQSLVCMLSAPFPRRPDRGKQISLLIVRVGFSERIGSTTAR